MNFLFNLCTALSFGVMAGVIGGIATRTARKKEYTAEQIARGQKLWKTGSRIMTYLTCLFLALGFIWCIYFLILGITSPEQAEYADNMSELIVSVLTVVSITFAFYEFVRRK